MNESTGPKHRAFVPRTRLNVFLEATHARRLADHALTKGVSKSSIVAAALASFLSPDASDQREAAIARRLDRLVRQFERLERDQSILMETVALYVRYFLSVSTPIPDEQQEAARVLGRVRFEKFIVQLTNHLQRGRSFAADIHRECFPNLQAAFSAPDAPSTSKSAQEQQEVSRDL